MCSMPCLSSGHGHIDVFRYHFLRFCVLSFLLLCSARVARALQHQSCRRSRLDRPKHTIQNSSEIDMVQRYAYIGDMGGDFFIQYLQFRMLLLTAHTSSNAQIPDAPPT